MFSRWKISQHCRFIACLSLTASFAIGQEATESVSADPDSDTTEVTEAKEPTETLSPVIWRGTMKNGLEDSMARLPFGKSETLRAPIAVHFPDQKSSICWDAKACRLVYAWKEGFLAHNTTTRIAEPAGQITYLASGPGPFSAAVGAYGKPKYFGFKLLDGVPEFYYSIGRVAIRERFSFSDDGTTLIQHFAIDNSPDDIVLNIPEAWKERVSSEKGSLKNRILTVKKANAADFTLNYSLISDETSAE